MLLTLRGAYVEDQVISPSKENSLMQTLRYYINKDLETKIELQAVLFFFFKSLDVLLYYTT